MTIDALHNEVRSHYRQLAQSVSALRLWQTRYVDDLAARHRQEMDDLARSFATRRQTAESEYRQEIAGADAGL